MLISTKQLLAQNKVVPAFNFGTLEVARSIIEAAEELSSLFILEINQKEVEFLGLRTAVYLAESFSKEYKTPFSLHFDHTANVDEFLTAAKLGFSSGLFDTSKLPLSESLAILRRLRQELPRDFMLEVTVDSAAQALQMEELGADLLAVEKDNYCDLSLLAEVRNVTKLPFVMHGGSSRTALDIQKAVDLGVVKINFNTCLRQAWRQGLESSFREQPGVLQSYQLLAKSRQLVREVAKEKMLMVKRAIN